MKKLAGLLALVMMLTACPILGVSAAELTDADLGLDQLKVAKTIDCKTDGTAPSGTTVNTTWGSNSAITFDTTNGMKMAYSTWDMNEGSCPLQTYKAFRFKGKMDGGRLDVRAGYAEKNISVWLNIARDNYNYRDASKAQHPTAFAFPAGWVDFLILPFSDGYDFYCKAEEASGWTEVGKRLPYDANTGHGTLQIGNLHSDKATAVSYVSEVLLYQDASAPTPTATSTPTATATPAPTVAPAYCTKEDAMGGTGEILYDLDFSPTFDGTPYGAGGRTINGANAEVMPDDTVTYLGENGLELADTGTAPWWWTNNQKGWMVMDMGRAVEFRAKLNGGNLDLQANYNPRLSVKITSGSINMVGGDGTSKDQGFSFTDFQPGSQWVTYLLTMDTDGYSIYVKPDGETDQQWRFIGKTEGFRKGGNGGFLMENFTTSVTYVDYVRLYQITPKVKEEDTFLENNRPYYQEKFEEDDLFSRGNHRLQFGETSEGKLVLTTTDEAYPGSLYLEQTVIPYGGYAEIKIKNNAATKVTMCDGRQGWSVLFATGEEEGLCRILRNQSGGYRAYGKTAEEEDWTALSLTSLGADAAVSFELTQSGGDGTQEYGRAEVEELTIYGPETNNDLLLMDGFTTLPASGEEGLTYPGELRAMVRANGEYPRMVLWIGYNREGVMVSANVEEVPRSERDVSVTLDTTKNSLAKSYRVFLWDASQRMAPMGEPLETAVEKKIYWTEGWALTGAAAAKKGVLSLNTPSGTESSATLSGLDETYDVEWKMQVHSFSGSENFQLRTGTHRMMMYPEANGIRFRIYDSGKDDGSSWTWQTIPYPVGNDVHTYRMVGEAEKVRIYIDGQDLGEYHMEKNTTTASIHVWNYSASGKISNLDVWDLVNVTEEPISWTDAFALTGSATAEQGRLSLNTPSGTESSATSSGLGEAYDVEWKMQVHSFSGSENFQLRTGTHRMMLCPKEDGIGFRIYDSEKDDGSSFVWKSIPYPVGNGVHTYRVVGIDGKVQVYIDGQDLGEFQAEKNISPAGIHIWNMGGSGKSSYLEVWDLEQGVPDIPAEPVIPDHPRSFYDEFNDGDYCGWDRNPYTCWESKDGILSGECTTTKGDGVWKNIVPGEEFVLEARIRIPSYGSESGMQVFLPGRKLQVNFMEKYMTLADAKVSQQSSEYMDLDDDWHTIRLESYHCGKNVILFIDGNPVADAEMPVSTRTDYHILVYNNAAPSDPATIEMDWISFTPTKYEVKMASPAEEAVYGVGEEIPLAVTLKDGQSPEKVEYQLHGQTVAVGTAPNYRASLSGLPAGTYEISAVIDAGESNAVIFTVESRPAALLQAEKDGGQLKLSLAECQEFEKVYEVTYLVDGHEVATTQSKPYAATAEVAMTEGHAITAVCKDAGGVILGEVSQSWIPTIGEGDVSTHFAHRISYRVTGEAGEADMELSNGIYALHLHHTADGVRYESDQGQETYEKGMGQFTVLTEGAVADVYRNGQLAFSYRMPFTDQVSYSVTEQGLSIEEASVVIPPERNNYFVERNLTEGRHTYDLSGKMPYVYHLDFVAEPEDEADLTLLDGYYGMHLNIRDGKLYGWDAERNNLPPSEIWLADMEPGTAHYRVEMAAGMARLYANGRWIATFRGTGVVSDTNLAVDVKAGALSYLAVSDNVDLYEYQDDFEGKGEFASIDYWQTTRMQCMTEQGRLKLNATGMENAIAELVSYIGNGDLSADVTLRAGTERFGFIYNHCVTEGYSRAIYDFAKKRFEIYDKEVTQESLKAYRSGSLPVDKTVHMELKIRETEDGKVIKVYVDGEEVISQVGSFDHRGKLGFILSNGVAYLDNVVYRGDAKPILAMTDSPLKGYITLDLIETEKELILTNESGGYKTSNGGKTWTTITAKGMMSYNMVRLQNGQLLSLVRRAAGTDENGQTIYTYHSGISKDDGNTWTDQGAIMEDALPGRLSMNNRVTQGPSGRIYFASSETNNEDYGALAIWYSDNNGEDWTESETYMDATQTGFCIQEGVVIELESGETRCYFRNEHGYLEYFISADRGKTWDLTPHRTPFLSTMSCFNVERDPEDGALYLAWSYDNGNLSGKPQYPRTRWSIAKSTDDGNTWEWLGTAHENNHVELNMMNLCINVSKDYLILQCFSDDEFAPGNWYSRNIVISKDKQKTSMRFEQLHTRDRKQIESINQLHRKRDRFALVIHPESNTILQNGVRTEGGALGEKISLAHGAAFVGATMQESGDSVLLQCEERVVSFSASDLTVSGGKIYVDAALFAEKFQLALTEGEGLLLISKFDQWSKGQIKSYLYAIDPYATIR